MGYVLHNLLLGGKDSARDSTAGRPKVPVKAEEAEIDVGKILSPESTIPEIEKTMPTSVVHSSRNMPTSTNKSRLLAPTKASLGKSKTGSPNVPTSISAMPTTSPRNERIGASARHSSSTTQDKKDVAISAIPCPSRTGAALSKVKDTAPRVHSIGRPNVNGVSKIPSVTVKAPSVKGSPLDAKAKAGLSEKVPSGLPSTRVALSKKAGGGDNSSAGALKSRVGTSSKVAASTAVKRVSTVKTNNATPATKGVKSGSPIGTTSSVASGQKLAKGEDSARSRKSVAGVPRVNKIASQGKKSSVKGVVELSDRPTTRSFVRGTEEASPPESRTHNSATASASIPTIQMPSPSCPDEKSSGSTPMATTSSSARRKENFTRAGSNGGTPWVDMEDGEDPACWASDKSGMTSPISTLDFMLAEGSPSPTSLDHGETSNTSEASQLDDLKGTSLVLEEREFSFQRSHLSASDSDSDLDKRHTSAEVESTADFLGPLEFSSVDFLGEIDGMEQDLEYVHNILLIAGYGGRDCPAWFSSLLPLAPTVFEVLEERYVSKPTYNQVDTGRQLEERRQRKLLFHAVNEALSRRLSPYVKLPPWVKLSRPIVRPRPIGKMLLREVWAEIHDWPVPSSEDVYDILDDAARRDMSRGTEKWDEFGQEQTEVGIDIEGLIFESLLDEVVQSFISVERRRLLKGN